MRPVKFVFTADKTCSMGFVAYDSEGGRVFFYPIFSDWEKQPVKFLHEAIIGGRQDFKSMMRKAYLSKKTVKIGQLEVYWSEYETLFKKYGFYQEKKPIKVLDIYPGEE